MKSYKILVLADEKAKRFYDNYAPGKLDPYDMIIACGDLSSDYLEFIVSMAKCPVFYVNGNHDGRDPEEKTPGGCDLLEGKIVTYKGIRMLGLGGSHYYNNHGPYQYTQLQMWSHVFKLWFKLWRKKGFDILVTHSPAFGLGDAVDKERDKAHIGFKAFNWLLDKYKPKYFIHGHQHLNYGGNAKRITKYNETTIINAYEWFDFDYEIED